MNTDTQTDQPLAVVRPEELPQSMPVSLFGGTEPAQVIERAARVASALRDVIEKQGLVSTISGRKYPRCEAWTLLGTMIGVFPVLTWTRPVEGGWEARVEARTRDGAIVGAAEAQCLKSERNWANRDDFALRSMAQTRATAKALRMPLGFVMTLGGFEATPAEEMAYESVQKPKTPAASSQSSPKNATKGQLRPNSGQREATEATRAWMLKELASYGEVLLHEYAVKSGMILDTEDISEWSLEKVPTSKEALRALMKSIEEFRDGGAPPSDFMPPPAGYTPSAGTRTADDEPDDVPDDVPYDPEEWRTFPMPFGKHAGVKLEDLDKKYLYGLWANYVVEKEFNGKAKSETAIQKDRQFRAYLDDAGQHYEFTKKD